MLAFFPKLGERSFVCKPSKGVNGEPKSPYYMYPKILLFLILLFAGGQSFAQQELISIARANGRVEIPFEYVNNFIIVNVVFNRLFPLKFVFDTGAENTILTRKEITD